MRRLTESMKLDVGVEPTSLATSNKTGPYYSLKDYRRVVGILDAAAIAATKTAKLELFEAQDAAGTGAQALTGAAATITANTKVAELTIALASVTAGQTITINGLVFTAHASTTTAANREFDISGTDTADGDALASVINDETYGVPGVTASNNAGTLTLTVDDPGATTITASSAAGTVTIATVRAVAYVEADHFDLSDGFDHVAAKVTTDATIVVAAHILRGDPRDAISQQVAASAAI